MNTLELNLKTMRVYVVDSSRLLTEGLTNQLANLPGLEIVGQADNLNDAVREIRLQNPDVVMLDVTLLGQSGLDMVNAVSRTGSAPFVMVLGGDVSGFESGPDILLYKAANVASAIAILENLLRHFQAQE
jgi:two-component system, NarL family, invasion response regulator UvrY